MKRFLLIPLAIILVTALIFGGCTRPAAEVPREIRVGDPASLTGPVAAFGEGGVFGVQAAVDDINKLGGVYVEEYGKKLPIKYIVVDTESDPLKTGTLAEDLVVRDKAHFLGTHLEPPHMRAAMATVADRYKILAVMGTGPFESWQGMRMEVTPPWKYTWGYGFAIGTPFPPGDFRADNPGYLMMGTWGGILDEYAGLTNKKVGAFGADDPDGKGWYMGFIPGAVEMGLDVYRADEQFGIYPVGTTDFSPIIQEWQDYGCEIIWGNCPGVDFGTLLRQSHMLGFQPPMVFSTRAALFYTDINAWGGDLPNGVTMEYFWSPELIGCPGIGDTTPQSLLERWTEATGEPLNQSIGWCYMGMQVLIDAIERAGTLDSDAVSKAVGETDMMSIFHRVVFLEDSQCHLLPCAMGQWVRTDNPWVWEAPVVFSYNDFLPATAEFLFPIPYD